MTASEAAMAVAGDRSESWWLLSGLVLERPTRESLAGLARAVEEVPKGLPVTEAAERVRDLLAEQEPGELAERLGPEFTRLFCGLKEGLGPPPPYESLYRGGGLLGPESQAVMQCYAEAGFGDITPEAGPQDHLGVELRFLSLLCYREMEAWQAGDNEAAGLARGRQLRFLEEHLLAWLPSFVEAIEQHARTPFYPAVVHLIEAFARQEQTALLVPQGFASVA